MLISLSSLEAVLFDDAQIRGTQPELNAQQSMAGLRFVHCNISSLKGGNPGLSAFRTKPLPARPLARRGRLDGERVDARFKFIGQYRIHGAVALDAAHAGEGRRDDADAEMRLAGSVEGLMMARLGMVMPGMEVALINDFQPFGRQRAFQLGFHV
jgi:hypothetical protein